MSAQSPAVLWLCGPPGVGKTTVGWEIYASLREAGFEAGYVDADQLGNFCPDPGTDPGRYRMQGKNFAAALAAFRGAGARYVVVSGVVDPAHGVYADDLDDAGLTVCRLRLDAQQLERRLVERGWPEDLVARCMREADALDLSGFAEVCVDTTGSSVAEVRRQVMVRTQWAESVDARRSTGAAESLSAAAHARSPAVDGSAADGSILLLCGATGVGKSTVGYGLFMRALGLASPGAYLDLDQIGFVGPAPVDDPENHRFKARVLASVWATFQAAGARHLTMTGPVRDQAALDVYRRALPAADITVCRLHAGHEALERRIMERGQGGSWAQPGDPLNGQSSEHLRAIAAAAAQDAAMLEMTGVGDVRVETDKRTVDECIDAILADTGWLTSLGPKPEEPEEPEEPAAR